MKDIFDAKISCKQCNEEMESIIVEKKGFRLRAVQCPKCQEKILHPSDVDQLNHYNDLKQKTYNVKLRVVGNSHAVSIPKEIVEESELLDKELKMNVSKRKITIQEKE